MDKLDLTNKTFGYLNVLQEIPTKRKHSKWLCKCFCGNTVEVYYSNLLRNRPKTCGCTLPSKRNLIKDIMNSYKAVSKRKGMIFTLDENTARELLTSNCFYCNKPPSNIRKYKTPYKETELKYNGIDRKDNLKGYTSDNCVSCCISCNKAKGNMSYKEFMLWINQLVIYRASLI